MFEEKAKPLPISKEMVVKAFKKVKANKGSAGVDGVSIQEFEANLSNNLYKLWNRMASGSYFPPPVREKEIKKDNGKTRKLGIPTVADRIAQQVIKDYIEPRLEAEFHPSSFGYRPGKSAHQALARVKENVIKYAWVLDLDITAFFDTIEHTKLMRALDRHVEERWVTMYIKRWLEAPVSKMSEEVEPKCGIGTPQGGVISPLLANLYLHYTFDKWMEIKFPDLSFERYADDIVIHCFTEKQACYVQDKLRSRLKECNLTMHQEKTSIVYCKTYCRLEKGKKCKFDFLGFSFRPISKVSKDGRVFLGYDCQISKKSYSKIVKAIRDTKFHCRAQSWQDIALLFNNKLRGWIQYYNKFCSRTLDNIFHRFHNRLIKWIMKHFKKYRHSKKRAIQYLKFIYRRFPSLFYHWEIGHRLV